MQSSPMENGHILKLVLNPNASIFYPTPILGNKITNVRSCKINTLRLDPNANIFHPTPVRGNKVFECSDIINQEVCSTNKVVDIISNYSGTTENSENEIQSHIPHPEISNIHNSTLNKTPTICEPIYSSHNDFRC